MLPERQARGDRAATLLAITALCLGACQRDDSMAGLEAASCEAETTPISSIQGDGFSTPLSNRVVTVRGVVTLETADGLFLESLQGDDSEATSEGLFLESAELAGAVAAGDLLTARGTVTERGERRNTLTVLTQLTQAAVCASDQALPLTPRQLPLSELQLEASESMRLTFRQALAVTGVYGQREGRIRISRERILPAPTEVAFPGDDARQQAWLNRQNMLAIQLPEAQRDLITVGATASQVQGVLGHDGRRLELRVDDEFRVAEPPPVPVPLPELGIVRVASLNLHNYFNGDGKGRGFPTPRGAETPGEYQRQRDRLTAAVRVIQPHLVAVMELENDGFETNSAAADLLKDLDAATNAEWRTMEPLDSRNGRVGTDQIRVGLFYRPDVLVEASPPMFLETQPFRAMNRPPIAQVFTHAESGVTLVIAVNHLKSKGSCPENGPDADNRDGASCWNRMRSTGAQAMVDWVNDLAGATSEGRALILGDMNAYRLEEPIARIIQAGFHDLTASTGLGHEYTFVFWGESGTLDYAFASPPLRPFVWKAQILKMNTPYPPGMPLEAEWQRFSDHDPVIVDLRFSHSSTAP